MFENLDLIRDLERQREQIAKIEAHICEPLLSELSYIQTIWDTIKAYGHKDKTEERMFFIFITLLFYAPKKLVVGARLCKRLMNELCKLTKCRQSLLSHNSENLMFYYQKYNLFHDNVDILLDKVTSSLVTAGVNGTRITEYLYKFNKY
ncbi:MAG: hypothetical protein KBT34_10545 [Prevotella sp.]|nr:hypothetical protein [Candidatus Prevotella equi]